MNHHSRRTSLKLLSAGALVAPAWAAALSKRKKSYGIALCGLGNYSKRELAPALTQTKLCHLTGLITGSPEKIPKWKENYQIKDSNICSYADMGELAGNEDIDIVYVVTPHGLHFRDTMAALKAGKHVFVEKPMAGTAEECRQMMRTAGENKVTLNVGYRLHYDPYHNAIREAARSRQLGTLSEIDSAHGYLDPKPRPTAWQINKKLSIAGALYSLGVYPMQASLYLLRENPIRVTATSTAGDPAYYKEVAATYRWTLEFPSGAKAQNRTTSLEKVQYVTAKGDKGILQLNPSFSYRGLKGHINNEPLTFPPVNQQASHMDALCESISAGKESLTPGTMGLRDVIILEAIMKSASTGKPVDLPELPFPAHR